MSLFKTFLTATAILGSVAAFAGTAQAAAGFIALEGSDATALHHDASYTPQLFKYLQGASALNVLVYDMTGAIDLSGISGGVGTTNTTTLTGVTLSNYSAIYIEAPSGCCTADNTALNGFGASVSAFIAAGGNLSIENYVGGAYDGVVPGGAGALASGVVAQGCSDGEKINATGLAKGFTQPPVDSCWAHQGYESSYFQPLGYSNLIDSSLSYNFADGTHLGSSFAVIGGTLGITPTPEPATLSILGLGLAGLGWVRRRRA